MYMDYVRTISVTHNVLLNFSCYFFLEVRHVLREVALYTYSPMATSVVQVTLPFLTSYSSRGSHG